MKSFFIFVLCLSAPLYAHSAIEIGVGTTSHTVGRLVPALNLSLIGEGWAMTGNATGVQSELYYHSAYGANYYWTWSSGLFLSGEVRTGLGVGAIYAARGFQDTGAEEETVSDIALGPAFHVNWGFAGPVYMQIEAMYGLRDLGFHLTLNAQDSISFSLGLRFL